jgi:hypothetical protein
LFFKAKAKKEIEAATLPAFKRFAQVILILSFVRKFLPGTDVMIFKIFSQKYVKKCWRFLLRLPLLVFANIIGY